MFSNRKTLPPKELLYRKDSEKLTEIVQNYSSKKITDVCNLLNVTIESAIQNHISLADARKLALDIAANEGYFTLIDKIYKLLPASCIDLTLYNQVTIENEGIYAHTKNLKTRINKIISKLEGADDLDMLEGLLNEEKEKIQIRHASFSGRPLSFISLSSTSKPILKPTTESTTPVDRAPIRNLTEEINNTILDITFELLANDFIFNIIEVQTMYLVKSDICNLAVGEKTLAEITNKENARQFFASFTTWKTHNHKILENIKASLALVSELDMRIFDMLGNEKNKKNKKRLIEFAKDLADYRVDSGNHFFKQIKEAIHFCGSFNNLFRIKMTTLNTQQEEPPKIETDVVIEPVPLNNSGGMLRSNSQPNALNTISSAPATAHEDSSSTVTRINRVKEKRRALNRSFSAPLLFLPKTTKETGDTPTHKPLL